MHLNLLGAKHRRVFGLSLLTSHVLLSVVLDIAKSGAEAVPPEIGIASFRGGQTSAEVGRGRYISCTYPTDALDVPAINNRLKVGDCSRLWLWHIDQKQRQLYSGFACKHWKLFSGCCRKLRISCTGVTWRAVSQICRDYEIEPGAINGKAHFTSVDGALSLSYCTPNNDWYIQDAEHRYKTYKASHSASGWYGQLAVSLKWGFLPKSFVPHAPVKIQFYSFWDPLGPLGAI